MKAKSGQIIIKTVRKTQEKVNAGIWHEQVVQPCQKQHDCAKILHLFLLNVGDLA